MYRWNKWSWCGWSLLALLTLGGCQRGTDIPPLAKVQGTVTLNGEPLPDALVTFEPTSVQIRGSSGVTDANGMYVLTWDGIHHGAVIADHTVTISTKLSPAAAKDAEEAVPAKYREKSELKAAVEAGENTIDFDLQSK